MKRFYKMVTVAACAGGHEIHLDGKPVKTPSGAVLTAPGVKLAQAVMGEWAAQEEQIVPDSMPLTQLLITAQDRVPRERAAMEKAVLAYLDTDLICYRAALPAETARRQAETWNPWLQWFEKEFGARLLTTGDLRALTQPPEARAAAEKTVSGFDDLRFTALQLAVSQSGSLVLGLAFMAGAATPEQVCAAAAVEEDFKAEFYNEEKHGAAPHEEKRRAAMMRDMKAARDFLSML